MLSTSEQVRAAALSGDCNWKYEFFRKNFNIAKQHQVRLCIACEADALALTDRRSLLTRLLGRS